MLAILPGGDGVLTARVSLDRMVIVVCALKKALWVIGKMVGLR